MFKNPKLVNKTEIKWIDLPVHMREYFVVEYTFRNVKSNNDNNNLVDDARYEVKP